jgi:hypothetical protein
MRLKMNVTDPKPNANPDERRRQPKTADDLFLSLRRRYPDETKAEHLKRFRDLVLLYEDINLEIIDWCHNHKWAILTRPTRQVQNAQDAPEAETERTKRKAEAKQRLDETVTAIAAGTFRTNLLEFVMPNGKSVRDCTGAEMRDMAPAVGDWFVAIAWKVKPRQKVGDVLTETDIANLCPQK